MRPPGIYVVWGTGRIDHIVTGYREARRLSPHRSYRRFPPGQRLQAEEFAAWWNHEHAPKRVLGLTPNTRT